MLFGYVRRKQARARYDTMRADLLEEDELDEHGGRRQAEEPFSEIMINQVTRHLFANYIFTKHMGTICLSKSSWQFDVLTIVTGYSFICI
jgi:hypothetical protein